MTSKNYKTLADVTRISRQFQRSIRIDSDFGREDSLHGYICQGTAKSVLMNTARHIEETKQRAFTWTGPYGGGKSSLALALCSLVSPKQSLRKAAQQVLGFDHDNPVLKAFNPGKKGWMVIPVVGKRSSVVQELSGALARSRGANIPSKLSIKTTSVELLKELVAEAESGRHAGVLVVIDELGKFLESAVHSGDDVYFYQELAEIASRCQGKLVIIGVLHQAFEQYASKLGLDAREEWSKVQGRFVDVPLAAGSDEMVELIGKAIDTSFQHSWTETLSKNVADSIKKRRPAINADFWKSLDNCWPLHPITSALLGPTSKRRFGQNERSTFGFLVSVEPKGFMEFLQSNVANEKNLYLPADYWDYLRVNLEPAILASPDAHRWAQAAEAVERAEAKGGTIHVKLTKTIALIEMFRNGSGLNADEETLCFSLPEYKTEEVQKELQKLKNWSVIAYRKHMDSWGVFAGSDFDIDAAVNEALITIADPDLEVLTKISNLLPVVAKRHYYTHGTLRWMNVSLCHVSNIDWQVSEYVPTNGSFGEFVLAIPDRNTTYKQMDNRCKTASKQKSENPIVIGAPKNGELIRELGRELLAIEQVRTQRPELEGDSVARREIDGRISAIRTQLENELREAFINSNWYREGEKLPNPGQSGLSSLASDLANNLYESSPYILSELINRDKPSGSGAKARKELLYGMLKRENQPRLGFEGYPAEAGLYHTLLSSSSLHREIDGKCAFLKPVDIGKGKTYINAWEAAEQVVLGADERVSLPDLYAVWKRPPYGIRDGVLPILMLAFVLANKHRIAVYKGGMFVPELQEADIDEALQDPSRISLRHVQIDEYRRDILEGLTKQMETRLGLKGSLDPLEAARALVALVYGLPQWVQRTTHLPEKSQRVRDTLLKASDPHKVLFVDLPLLFEGSEMSVYVEEIGLALSDLAGAYDAMLRGVISKMLVALDANLNDVASIKHRAKTVAGISGDFRQDAFATRLSLFEDNREFYEGLLSLAANKPPRDWNDLDIDAALISLADWALRFRQVEALAAVRDRDPTRQAIAVVFGTGDHGETVSETFDVSEQEQIHIQKLADLFVSHMDDVRTEVFLAALAKAGVRALVQKRGS